MDVRDPEHDDDAAGGGGRHGACGRRAVQTGSRRGCPAAEAADPGRQRDGPLTSGLPHASPKGPDRQQADQDVRHPPCPVRRELSALHQAFEEHHDRVVERDHPQAQRQPSEFALAACVDAERHADDGKDQAGHRERHHLVPVHDLWMGRDSRGDFFCLDPAEIRNRHFGFAARQQRVARPEDRISRHGNPQVAANGHVVDVVVAGHVSGRFAGQDDGHFAAFGIDFEEALRRQRDGRAAGLTRVSEHHVEPDTAGRHVADADDLVREALEEQPRADVVLAHLRQQAEGFLAELLVGVRHQLDQQVHVQAAGDDGQGQDGTQQPHRADATREHGDGLAVGRQAPEAHEDARQERHGNGDAE